MSVCIYIYGNSALLLRQGVVTEVLSEEAGLYMIDGEVGLCLAHQPPRRRGLRTGDHLQVTPLSFCLSSTIPQSFCLPSIIPPSFCLSSTIPQSSCLSYSPSNISSPLSLHPFVSPSSLHPFVSSFIPPSFCLSSVIPPLFSLVPPLFCLLFPPSNILSSQKNCHENR